MTIKNKPLGSWDGTAPEAGATEADASLLRPLRGKTRPLDSGPPLDRWCLSACGQIPGHHVPLDQRKARRAKSGEVHGICHKLLEHGVPASDSGGAFETGDGLTAAVTHAGIEKSMRAQHTPECSQTLGL